jgi:hypothetical protein
MQASNKANNLKDKIVHSLYKECIYTGYHDIDPHESLEQSIAQLFHWSEQNARAQDTTTHTKVTT